MSVGDAMPWALFTTVVLALLALDLLVFHRSAHEVSRREALTWSVFWIALALTFNAGVFWWRARSCAENPRAARDRSDSRPWPA